MSDVFITHDLGLAAALQVKGYTIIKAERRYNNIYDFYFDSEAKEEYNAYFSGELLVPALAYSNAIKNLKTYISNQQTRRD